MTYQGKSVEGAEISVFLSPEEDPSVPPFVTGTTGRDGRFSLKTGPGKFYLVARKRLVEEGRAVMLRGRPSREPVSAGEFATISLARVDSGAFHPEEKTFVKGRVSGDYRGAFAYLYDGKSGVTTGPSYLTRVPVGEDGSFLIPAREGMFNLVVMKRERGEDVGPPGDLLRGVYGKNPFSLRRGEVYDAGIISLSRPGQEDLEERKVRGGVEKASAWIEGEVVDEYGNPQSRLYVMAYPDERMRGRPVSVTEVENGKFLLPLPGEGVYFLGAREILGGPSSPGEKVGIYEGTPDHSVVVKNGEKVRGVRIVVREKW